MNQLRDEIVRQLLTCLHGIKMKFRASTVRSNEETVRVERDARSYAAREDGEGREGCSIVCCEGRRRGSRGMLDRMLRGKTARVERDARSSAVREDGHSLLHCEVKISTLNHFAY